MQNVGLAFFAPSVGSKLVWLLPLSVTVKGWVVGGGGLQNRRKSGSAECLAWISIPWLQWPVVAPARTTTANTL
jgi:hypothetical protein